jgi:hypothetical protein
MKHLLLIGLLTILCATRVCAQPQLLVYPTINSIGYELTIPSGYDADTSAHLRVRYRMGSGTWHEGFEATRLTIDRLDQFRGSLFQLNAGSSYFLELTLTDSTPSYHSEVFSATVLTRTDPVITPTEHTLFVAPHGSGTSYTRDNPGDLKRLLTTGVDCGTTVVLRGGDYDAGEMTLKLKAGCNTPIILMAEPGETPVIDGGDYQQYHWTPSTSDPALYSTTIKDSLAYNALCLFDSTRLYPYAFLTPNSIDPSYPSLSTLGYAQSGFYRKGSNAWIKTLDHRDPNSTRIVFSKYFWCLNVEADDSLASIQIKGITFRYYNKGKSDFDIFGNPTASYPSWTLRFTNISNAVVDSCTFLYTNLPIVFDGICNGNIVQRCVMTDGTGYWSHGAFKQTRDQYFFEAGSYGRYLESSGIFYSPGDSTTLHGNIIRDNHITGIVNAVGLAFGQSYRMMEWDIYRNAIDYCYDGLDPTAACINTRLWQNTIAHCPVAISLILPTFGPTYIFRNLIHHIAERENQHNDIFYADCNGSLSSKTWGTGLKLNAGNGIHEPGVIYFMHNTIHSSDSLGFNLYLWNSTWRKLVTRNNIFYSEGIANFMFDGVAGDSSYSFDSKGDNFFNRRTGDIAIIRPTHGVQDCETVRDPASLDARLTAITLSPLVAVSGMNVDPEFIDIARGNFRLLHSSPMIDRGMLLPGINDEYKNNAPDLGAFEEDTAQAQVARTVAVADDWLTLSPNPASTVLHVSINGEAVDAFTMHDLLGREVPIKFANNGREISIHVEALPTGVYFLDAISKKRTTQIRWMKK